ncbi:MAG: antibiotic biosynthesis monooxygenase [Gammaproteobacteria bacterium]|nr:antibiotic biosynthesis monooxygenase [Pseudomonadota bacterium]TDJ24410.1 MAG: antibiotic biosynthesis monooxygenase [Gammaproteobacteria bacterium]TDJ36836.1 MAG: antibiotic biosynthesis monooxygenase [Gammaproteobacteria bacterium]
MIIVHATIPIRSDCREKALELARQMTAATQAEVGCISYDFYIGLSDPNTLMLFQEWESMEALMGHFQTEHMDEFLKELPQVVSGEVTTRRYAVQSVDEDSDERGGPPPVIH